MSVPRLLGVRDRTYGVDLLLQKDLCEAGKVSPLIDRRFPLSEVPAAVRYVEAGHTRGEVVITI